MLQCPQSPSASSQLLVLLTSRALVLSPHTGKPKLPVSLYQLHLGSPLPTSLHDFPPCFLHFSHGTCCRCLNKSACSASGSLHWVFPLPAILFPPNIHKADCVYCLSSASPCQKYKCHESKCCLYYSHARSIEHMSVHHRCRTSVRSLPMHEKEIEGQRCPRGARGMLFPKTGASCLESGQPGFSL